MKRPSIPEAEGARSKYFILRGISTAGNHLKILTFVLFHMVITARLNGFQLA